ncbi:hypothetical protein ACFL59_11910 [Planctomycetota bacterium]
MPIVEGEGERLRQMMGDKLQERQELSPWFQAMTAANARLALPFDMRGRVSWANGCRAFMKLAEMASAGCEYPRRIARAAEVLSAYSSEELAEDLELIEAAAAGLHEWAALVDELPPRERGLCVSVPVLTAVFMVSDRYGTKPLGPCLKRLSRYRKHHPFGAKDREAWAMVAEGFSYRLSAAKKIVVDWPE